MKKMLLPALAAVFLATACNSGKTSDGNASFEKELQEKFVHAKDGDVIELPEGTFILSRPLVLDKVKHVTIKGKGKDKTILSFKGQKDGPEGIKVTADGIVMEDFAVMDTKGDAIKVQDATGVTFRRIKTGWTNTHNTQNGSYGTYPVGCTNVLIEECEVSGASDAGIYVGQSRNIIVRKNHVHDNVAGIEIENSTDADVYENLSENNTGGVLVFDLPELPKKNGSRCRVYNNRLINNNTPNFGVKGTTVSEIPAGTGIIVMATNFCDVFNNIISGQNTMGISLVSYLSLKKPFKDSIYDPYNGGINVHGNTITRGTGGADNSVDFGKIFIGVFGTQLPDIIYDGTMNPAYVNSDGTVKEDQRICIRDNGKASFSNLDLLHGGKNQNSDMTKFDCTLPQIPAVNITQ